jgi:serine/threonine-protein kinase
MSNTLPQNYKLNARYTILHQIGQGGFGITYKAHDSLFDRVVCIKELFLSGNSRREDGWNISSQSFGNIDFTYFKNKFLDEAKKLANFDHPNIVKVLEYFETNNTAYMVMQFVEGMNLQDYVLKRTRLNEQEAIELFSQLLNATKFIHNKNYLHRDIKPGNILITPENKVVLIDFGTAKFQDETNDNGNTSTLVLLSHGYAPPESYSNKHQKGYFTDIYALGATLYFMLTGIKPVQATDRTIQDLEPIHKFQSEISTYLINVVEIAMNLKPSERFQDVSEIKISYEPIIKKKHIKSDNNDVRLNARVKVKAENSVVENNQKPPTQFTNIEQVDDWMENKVLNKNRERQTIKEFAKSLERNKKSYNTNDFKQLITFILFIAFLLAILLLWIK